LEQGACNEQRCATYQPATSDLELQPAAPRSRSPQHFARWHDARRRVSAGIPESDPSGARRDNARTIIFIMGDDIGWFNIGAYHRGMVAAIKSRQGQ
jgi:hypothetical protein